MLVFSIEIDIVSMLTSSFTIREWIFIYLKQGAASKQLLSVL